MMRVLLSSCVLVLCAAGCASSGDEAAETPAPVHVRCEAASVETIPRTRTVRGVVAPAPESDALVAPLVGGVIARVLVREGDVVRFGQVVAEIDAQALRDVLTEARASLAQATATAATDAAALEHERRLVEQGIAARHGLEVATFADDHGRAGIAAARASVSIAARNVSRSHLRTPISGVVLRVLRHAGELVDGTPTTPVMEIADPASIEMNVSASPADLVVFVAGQPGVAHFDALGARTWNVSLRSFAPAVDPITGVGAARFAFVAAEGGLPPFGVFGSVHVRIGEQASAVTVPASALRNPTEDGSEVLVCVGGVVRVREVVTGIRAADRVEIVRGLGARDRVVVDDVIGIEDGTRFAEGR